ncbi:MAG: S8 family serine peptidase [Anaerolineae bacterium]
MWKTETSQLRRVILLTAVALLAIGSLAPPLVVGQQLERVRVLIAFKSRPGPAEEALVRRAGGQLRYTYRLVDAIAASLPESAVERLRANPRVLRVEPDLQMRALDIELDNAWGVKRIGAGLVHADAGYTGSEVKLAIIDSGIAGSHPDLDNNYVGGHNFVQENADPTDVYGHGTHVAGIACAEDNDNGDATGPYGTVGVAPACALYSLRVLTDDGFGDSSDLIAALEWAVENGIQVTNLSLGWDRDPGQTVEDAFIAAEQAGIVIVAAACNNGNPPGKGENVCWPGKYASVIAVAATDAEDRRASFSSTGTEVELAAPGAAVFSTWNDATSYADPQPVCRTEEEVEACYKYASGTSMASPHVAGAAALLIAAGITDANGNGRINDEVRQLLIDTAEDLGDDGWDPHYGYGLVRPDLAVASLGDPSTDSPPSASIFSPADGSTVSGNVTIQVSASDVEDAKETLAVEVEIDERGWQTASYNEASGYHEFIWETAELSDESTHTINATVTDSAANTAGAEEVTVTVDNSVTSSLHVGDLDGTPISYGSTWAAVVTVTVHDAEDNPLPGANVLGSWDGGSSGSAACTTGTDGRCTLTSDPIHKRTHETTFAVQDVTAADVAYDASANHDPDGDSDGTSITVLKP